MRGATLLLLSLQLLVLEVYAAPSAESGWFTQQDDAGNSGDTEFDYIVVGGGTAGIVVATRLAQESLKVALVEAGGTYEVKTLAAVPAADVIPVGSDPNTRAPHDWGFVAQNIPGANGRSIHYARGKCLGGSSALNFMVYQRPTRESMEDWAIAVNDSSYTFDKVLPYYKKSVQFTPPNMETRFLNATANFDISAYEPEAGPLQVSYANYAMPFSTWAKRGMKAIGIREIEDFNVGSLMGAQYCASTINPGDETRSSSQASFLATINVPTLTIYSKTLAKKILFDKYKKASGVLVKDPLGKIFTLRAKKEVIISAGAFQSPQLLMVSGIGPKDILQKYKIDLLAESPGVGQNMWDHPFFGPTYRVTVDSFAKLAPNLLELAEKYLASANMKDGPLTNPVADYLAWEKIPKGLRSHFTRETLEELAKFPDDWPEVEYIPLAGYIGNVSNLVADQPQDGYQYASIVGVLVSPTSRGTVTLKSADTDDLPVINPNWLATKSDQEVVVAIFKRIRQAFQSRAMAPVVIGTEYDPGTSVQTDEEILEYIRDNMMTSWHAACTCKMGAPDDKMSVVDSQARVYGVDGLRVVDASAFPILPPGHPQSTVYMLAEKISDLIVNGFD
ncbi:hypothetical protein BBP40_011550 [Aspergillus hancockii]|nr:hypothetical protein BBP40_011550 [Aspergillus hancockii]